jgi:hypothetical protein
LDIGLSRGLASQPALHQDFEVLRAGFVPPEAKMKRVIQVIEAERVGAAIVRAIQKRAMCGLARHQSPGHWKLEDLSAPRALKV